MNFGTLLYTWFYGNIVGEDDQCNKYYCDSKNFETFEAKRWVIFNGEIESTKIPPHWHAWLHKTVEKPPLNYKHSYKWQKDHKQNMTGTDEAYYPESHPLSQSYNKEVIKDDYETWKP